jgi:hypothetical protein
LLFQEIGKPPAHFAGAADDGYFHEAILTLTITRVN